jgi:hypothetical protein
MDFLFESSPLQAMGYTVGTKATSSERRREILRIAIQHPWSADVRRKFSDAQLMEWGDPGADRYRKIVAKLRAQIDNFRGQKGEKYSDAIHDWESDLRWVQQTFEKFYGS